MLSGLVLELASRVFTLLAFLPMVDESKSCEATAAAAAARV